MKRVVVGAALVGSLMMPGLAAAGSSTDAALGLGAFAVFNQILSGPGVFGGGRTVVVERPVVVAPPPPVVYSPPPPVYYAPAPRPVVVYPAPPVVYRAPGYAYAPAPVYGHVPPGHWKHRHWKYHRHHD